MNPRRHLFGLPSYILAATACCLPCVAASAAEPLLWRFKPGDVHRYRVTIDLESTLTLGDGKGETRTVRHVIDMSWRVAGIKENGQATLVQKIDRLQMKLTSPGEEAVEFDSAMEKTPESFAAMIAPLAKELIGSEVHVTMTPQGEVTAVEVPEALLTAIKNSPGADKLGDLATEKGFQNLVQTLSFKLPKEFEEGAQWSTTLATENPLLGKQTSETTYRHKESREVDGQPMEAFTPTVVMKFENSPAKITVSEEESSGEILFNRAAGRLESSRVEHGMKLTIAADGEELKQELKQTVEMKRLNERGG
jgi:hypothetical protein